MVSAPATPLRALRGIGPVREAALAAAGIHSAEDLLFHLPARYEDRRRRYRIDELATPGPVSIVARLESVSTIRRGRRALVRAQALDPTGSLPVVWFNQPYIARRVEAGTEYLLTGSTHRRGEALELVNPSCEPASRALHGGRILPVYPPLAGLGPARLRRLFTSVLEQIDPARRIGDPLPAELRRRHGLPALGTALARLHRPEETASVEELNGGTDPAHQRLVYGELLALQLRLAVGRARRASRVKPHRYRIDDRMRRIVRTALPFRLTAAQRRVLAEIVADLEARRPMQRLLQGDVGSGKTAVAAIALLVAVESGLQGALLAPTELLAVQHWRTVRRWLGDRHRAELLTAAASDADGVRARLATGHPAVVVGTHALLEERVELPLLALAVIDEQQRFGVEQRRALLAKGGRPDLLVMTATPIPRSLALTLYGDLDLSVLDELPPGRRPVTTTLVPAARRREIYRQIGERLAGGGQAYIVVPLIDANDRLEAASVERLGRRVVELLAPHPCAVLHGRVGGEERARVMADFAEGRVRALVATTIVEVGVDVPGADAMVIESAERFGLAQLHQLRGRIGRGERPAACWAVHGRLTEAARRRLAAFEGSTDGFALAEMDLALRGPGELLGRRQSGLPALRAADLARDRIWLERARADAEELVADWQRGQRLALREHLIGCGRPREAGSGG